MRRFGWLSIPTMLIGFSILLGSSYSNPFVELELESYDWLFTGQGIAIILLLASVVILLTAIIFN
jgi:hypothetical protein